MYNNNNEQIEYQNDEQDQPFSYQKFQKTSSFPVPLIAQNAQYTSILPLKQLGFLQYFMLPQNDQFQYVYRPGDDSFFMLNVLKQQLKHWIDMWGQIKQQNNNQSSQKSFNNCIIAEVGSGSGILSAHVSSWLKQLNQSPLLHVSIDINMDASILSQKYYHHYNLPVLQINASLFKNTIFSQQNSINSHLKPQIIIFNPPYIPVQEQEIQNEHKYLVEKFKTIRQTKKVSRKRQQNMIAYSYMGGVDGLQVTRKLLKSIFWDCWVYLIIMQQQGYIKLTQQLKNNNQFWPKQQYKKQIKAEIKLMQFMKYQNQDLFLVRVHIFQC